MVMLWIKMWTKSLGRLPTYLLVGGSGLNIVHTCSLFYYYFLVKKKKSTRHAYQWSQKNEDFSYDLEFWTCFPDVRGFDIWMCFLEVRWFEVWTCFSEVRWFEVWTWILEVRWIWIWMCFLEVRGFLDVLRPVQWPMVQVNIRDNDIYWCHINYILDKKQWLSHTCYCTLYTHDFHYNFHSLK